MNTTELNVADYLDSKELIAECLSRVLQEGDTAELLGAIGHTARVYAKSKFDNLRPEFLRKLKEKYDE